MVKWTKLIIKPESLEQKIFLLCRPCENCDGSLTCKMINVPQFSVWLINGQDNLQ